MNERELRIALVMYGGLSLAVYMHGISKEIQKLVRASKVLSAAIHSGSNPRAGYDAFNDDADRETDSERVYFDLLQQLSMHVNLRVVVDVISGTSAGGINGIMLARSLAHDLPLDQHRSMWLHNADVTELMDPGALPTRWSKAYVRPVLWGLRRAAGRLAPEVIENLSKLIRGRWWQPPFSGIDFYHKLVTAMRAMGDPQSGRSLVPYEHPLSLFVSLTDLFGQPMEIELHSPARLTERVHQHSLEFTYRAGAAGVASDFDSEGIPALAFAARATSSYAGLFPPMTLAEALSVLEADGSAWPAHEEFFATRLSLEPEIAQQWPFVDGGVLNNKPFKTAIDAIRTRPASRKVARRLLYVEPNPESGNSPQPQSPSYFGLIKRTLVDLPGTEPIGEELRQVAAANAEIRALSVLISRVRPRINNLVQNLLEDNTSADITAAQLANLRNAADRLAREQAGYAFFSYHRIRFAQLLEQLHAQHPELHAGAMSSRLMQWVELTEAATTDAHDKEVRLLDYLDRSFPIRRLRFVVRRVNELYSHSHAERDINQALNGIKEKLYNGIHMLESDDGATRALGSLFTDAPSAASLQPLATLGANASNTCDQTLLAIVAGPITDSIRNELRLAYLSFSFFDVLTWPLIRSAGRSELEQVKVVRLSPEDSQSIRRGGADATLKGTGLDNFAGFFSRAYRENDYLWGRLHGAERMVDLVLDAIADVPGAAHIDTQAIKTSLFESILGQESTQLEFCAAEIDKIRTEIAQALAMSAEAKS